MHTTAQLIKPFDNFWPWNNVLPHVYLKTVRFHPEVMNESELAHRGITLPESLTKAAPKRRREFLAGRYCAYQALQDLTGVGSIVERHTDGAPCWPKGCVGSISHSDRWAGALVAYQANYLALGFDIEPILNPTQGAKLAAYLLTPQEKSRLRHVSTAQFSFMVTLVFSLKESLFKALYLLVKKRFYFEDAELISWCSHSQTAHLRLLSTLSEEWRYGQEIAGQYCCVDRQIMSLIALPNPSSEQRL